MWYSRIQWRGNNFYMGSPSFTITKFGYILPSSVVQPTRLLMTAPEEMIWKLLAATAEALDVLQPGEGQVQGDLHLKRMLFMRFP